MIKRIILILFLSNFTLAAIAAGTSTTNSSVNNTTTTNSSAQNAGNAQNINFNNLPATDTTVRSVPIETAPALTTTLTDTCMGSSSGSFSGIGFGFSAGSTWNDLECVNRLNARELAALGDKDAAKEVMCNNDIVRKAYEAVGRPCKTH